MRLLVVTPWPLDSPGGAQRLAAGIAEALTTHHGIDVVVAAGSGSPGTPAFAERSAPFREVRLALERHAASSGARAPLLDTTLRGLEALAERVRPDAILYTPHASSCGQQAQAVAAARHIPLVIWPAVHLDQRGHTGGLARRFYQQAALVLCLSDVERDWLIRRAGVAPHRALTIGCGWNGATPMRTRPARARGPVQLLTVGGYTRHKRIDDQIEALARLRATHRLDARLVVAGARREPAVLDGLRRLAERRGVGDRVAFVVDCPDTEIERLHAGSDVFLFTSESESYGLAVHEAIAFGTPPVVYPHPVYRTLVEGARFGGVARRSTPAALARAIAQTADAGGGETRLAWLAERAWPRVAAPVAARLAAL
jgi:glycosyltransferase involved in cell wall biosynthesis